MTPITEILARMLAAFAVDKDSALARMCGEVATGLKEIYPDGQVPPGEAILVEELFLIRITSSQMETLLGAKGMFIRRGDSATLVVHPALATTMRNRERFKKTWNCLAWRHGAKGLQPSREKALAKAANSGVGAATSTRANHAHHADGVTMTSLRASLQTMPNVGPLVKPDVVSGIANGPGTLTRADLLRPVKAAVAV